VRVKKLSPVLRVKDVEAVLPFWEERLGFGRTVEIPDGDGIGFVICVRDGVEVMLQSEASAKGDMPALAGPAVPGTTALFIEVESLEPFLKKLKPEDQVAPLRDTFYGMREAILRDPAGHVVVLAAPIRK
jgi:uncharacterized glyoxalase superfamily protein PhnB